jgi:hypothetical protein
MSLDVMNQIDIIEAMENFIEMRRPPEKIRHEVDLSYKIDNQSVIIFEIRPKWNEPKVKMECDIAKTTFVKATNKWKVFWQRANMKWYTYSPNPEVDHINDFITLVDEDAHHCFWG